MKTTIMQVRVYLKQSGFGSGTNITVNTCAELMTRFVNDQSASGVLTKGEIYYDYEGLCENLNVHMREKNNELRVDFLKTLIQDYSELTAEEKLYCTCGNPSEEGNCHFEGDEKLIYECADCGKPTKQFQQSDKVVNEAIILVDDGSVIGKTMTMSKYNAQFKNVPVEKVSEDSEWMYKIRRKNIIKKRKL